MIKFTAMNLIVGLSASLLTYRIFKISNLIDSLIAFFLFYLAQIIATELLLGLAGLLYLKYLILTNLCVLLLLMALSKKKRLALPDINIKTLVSELLKNKIVLLIASIIIGFTIIKIFTVLTNPPFGWDDLSYHFVFPVEWLKTGNLDTPITICDDPSPPYYPINGSLFFLWLILPFKSVFMANLGQLPFFVLAFLSIYNISRKIGIPKELSFYAAGFFIIVPNVFRQIELGYVDVMIAALYLAGLNFLINLNKNFSLKTTILWAIAFGIFLGTKTSAIIYGIPLVILFALITLQHHNSKTTKKIPRAWAVFLLITIALGGFAYIRNIILTGNPIFPAEIKILGQIIFSGVMPMSSYRGQWTPHEFNLEKMLFHEGMGGQFLVIGFPAIFISAIFFILKRKKLNLIEIFILLSPLTLYFFFWFLMPQLWIRYLYPCVAAGFIAGFYLLNKFNASRLAIRVLVTLCSVASMFEMSRKLPLVYSIILSGLIFFVLPKILKLRLHLKMIVTAIVLILVIIWQLSIDYKRFEYRRYLERSPFPKEDRIAWEWLNKVTHKSKIAYAGIPHVLPLYGTDFKNDVLYVSVNRIEPPKLHLFPKARYIWNNDFLAMHKSLEDKGNFRQDANFQDWLKNLKINDIDYLVVYSLRRITDRNIFPIEDLWALSHPDKFSLDLKTDTVHVYKLIK